MSTLSYISPSARASVSPDLVLDGMRLPVLALSREGDVLYANAAAETCLGPTLTGSKFEELFSKVPSSLEIASALAAPFSLVCRSHRPYRAFAGRAANGDYIVSLFPDDLETSSAPEVDDLTGLIKRNGLNEHLERSLAASAGGQASLALHFLDLDRFKVVNDTLGHAIGDLLLVKVAERIRSVCRAQDCVARLGGDEFVVVQTDVADPQDAERVAARLVDLIGRTYVLGGHAVNVGVSVGVAMTDQATCARDLLRNGDLALYEAKRAGRGRFRVFEPGMDAALRQRRELEIDLRRALALKQFILHYQPFLDLETNEVIGYEALIRWEHPTRGRVSPADFIPLAEETGLISKIGDWVLRTACATAMTWPDQRSVAVNVSPVQFKTDRLVDTVQSALNSSGLPPERLEIEITEGAFLEDTPDVLKTLHALRDLGVKISMDDFGTGYASLSYLQKFPFDKIKIDQSFVRSSDDGGDGEAILKAIASLGSSLGMAITAEGVETAEQLARIRGENCTHVQGFYTGRPQPAGQLPQNPEPANRRRP